MAIPWQDLVRADPRLRALAEEARRLHFTPEPAGWVRVSVALDRLADPLSGGRLTREQRKAAAEFLQRAYLTGSLDWRPPTGPWDDQEHEQAEARL